MGIIVVVLIPIFGGCAAMVGGAIDAADDTSSSALETKDLLAEGSPSYSGRYEDYGR